MFPADPWPLCPGVWDRRRRSVAVLMAAVLVVAVLLVAVLAPASTSPRLHPLLVQPLALGLGLAWVWQLAWQWELALESKRPGVPRPGLTTASL